MFAGPAQSGPANDLIVRLVQCPLDRSGVVIVGRSKDYDFHGVASIEFWYAKTSKRGGAGSAPPRFRSDITAFAGIAGKQLFVFVHKAWRQRVGYLETASYGFHFLLAQLTSAYATKYTVILVHCCSPFLVAVNRLARV